MTKTQRWLLAAVAAGALALEFVVPALAYGGGVGGGSGFGGGGGGGGGGGFSGGGGGFGGGGFGFPLFFPFFGFGGGLFGPLLLFLLFLWLSRMTSGGSRGGPLAPVRPSSVNLIRMEIGLLATAKDVPTALHQLVASTDTSNNVGLSQLLQQSALLLLRHQPYWHAASYSFERVPYSQGEAAFNSMTMQARAKLSYETITNVSGMRQTDTQHLPAPADSLPPGDYIVVVLVVASSAPMHLRQARTQDEIREQLAEIAAAAGPNLEAFEVIWQPDSPNEALSRDDLITMYPELAPI